MYFYKAHHVDIADTGKVKAIGAGSICLSKVGEFYAIGAYVNVGGFGVAICVDKYVVALCVDDHLVNELECRVTTFGQGHGIRRIANRET